MLSSNQKEKGRRGPLVRIRGKPISELLFQILQKPIINIPSPFRSLFVLYTTSLSRESSSSFWFLPYFWVDLRERFKTLVIQIGLIPFFSGSFFFVQI